MLLKPTAAGSSEVKEYLCVDPVFLMHLQYDLKKCMHTGIK